MSAAWSVLIVCQCSYLNSFPCFSANLSLCLAMIGILFVSTHQLCPSSGPGWNPHFPSSSLISPSPPITDSGGTLGINDPFIHCLLGPSLRRPLSFSNWLLECGPSILFSVWEESLCVLKGGNLLSSGSDWVVGCLCWSRLIGAGQPKKGGGLCHRSMSFLLWGQLNLILNKKTLDRNNSKLNLT